MKLERTGKPRSPRTSEVDSPMSNQEMALQAGENSQEDEEAELGHWADVREYQNRFAQAGGVLSEL